MDAVLPVVFLAVVLVELRPVESRQSPRHLDGEGVCLLVQGAPISNTLLESAVDLHPQASDFGLDDFLDGGDGGKYLILERVVRGAVPVVSGHRLNLQER
jgi:hypothetical protein